MKVLRFLALLLLISACSKDNKGSSEVAPAIEANAAQASENATSNDAPSDAKIEKPIESADSSSTGESVEKSPGPIEPAPAEETTEPSSAGGSDPFEPAPNTLYYSVKMQVGADGRDSCVFETKNRTSQEVCELLKEHVSKTKTECNIIQTQFSGVWCDMLKHPVTWESSNEDLGVLGMFGGCVFNSREEGNLHSGTTKCGEEALTVDWFKTIK